MDAFRNQFLNTFSGNPPAQAAPAQESAAAQAAAASGTSGR
jgi:hypothetical protein